MGTNYYVGRRDGTINPDIEVVKIHIGKYSYGWAFHWQGNWCKSVHDWNNRLNCLPGEAVIVDEYGEVISNQRFWDIVHNSKANTKRGKAQTLRKFAIEQGYDSDQGRLIAWEFLTGKSWEDDGYTFSDMEFA